ncbi:MAG: hypothetical protein ACLRLX_01835, partial [Anaerovoracaceae bacterium]
MALPAPEEAKIYTSVYNNFKGVDFTNDPTQVYKRRSPSALNMIPDDGGIPYKRTGWRVEYNPLNEIDEKEITDMWAFDYADESHILYVKNGSVYNGLGDNTKALITMKNKECDVVGIFFNAISGGAFYILADNELMEYTYSDNDGNKTFYFKDIQPYVPTTIIGREASGGGKVYENANLLTRKRKESFLGDSKSLEYYTTLPILKNSEIVKIKNESGEYDTLERVSDYTVDNALGKIIFKTVKPPVLAGEDNIIIEYSTSNVSTAAEQLKKCSVASVYNNKVFLSGAGGIYKSYVWYSAYENANYFPDLNYFVVGDDFTSVMGLIDLGEYLGVIKEADPESSTIFLAYSLTFDETSAYAVKQSITGIGALSKKSFNSLNGEQLFLSEDGIYGISAQMGSDDSYLASTAVMNRSYFINKKLLKEENLFKSVSVVWRGFYILC